jgi:hypothetical protein
MTRKQFGHFIVLWLFISFSSLFIGFRPSINSVGKVFYQLPMEVEFPCLPNPPKGHHWMYRLVVEHMGVYDCVRWMIVSFWSPFSSFLLYTGYGSAGDLHLERGIMYWQHVTQGQESTIVYRSTLPHFDQYRITYHFDLHLHSLALVCNCIIILYVCS